ncbi:DDE-type integrase/transposase/recombinase [Rapidithrix thailandica]|uniref:DDE-type integrase/transposase/recombinase n=1 Tax=Rapidithrix thailandica TaxID=413964 RepID=A0AAW9SAW4_9BACT
MWATDITYIPMKNGFMYLMAIIDLYSRYVVHWSVSNSMEAEWCTKVFKEAVERQGAPKILNTDQGSQFTSEVFSKAVLAHSQLSMDGKGRATDNAFIERLWRTVKYEKVYLEPPTDGVHLYHILHSFFDEYNHKRRHNSIEDDRPKDRYFSCNPPRNNQVRAA